MSDYYDWHTTLTKDADVTMVVSIRGKGKTYGLRKQFVIDFLKDGSRFVEICRYKDELKDVADGYFEKLEENGEFPEHQFKTEKNAAYIAKKVPEGEKPQWKKIGYFVALTQMQRSKKKTFVNVYRLLMDEAVISRVDRFHRYLPGEFALLTNVVDSCTREHAGERRKHKPHVYLLGNACDLTNPYFARYGVKQEPPYGYSWHDGKTFLLDYVEPGDDGNEKLNDTVSGRMARGTAEADVIARNKFANAGRDFIAAKPPRAKFSFGIKYRDETYGIWIDWQEGYYYVNEKVPNNTTRPVYALTAADNSVNLVAAKRADKTLKSFVDMYYMGIVRYETPACRENMLRALSLFGVR